MKKTLYFIWVILLTSCNHSANSANAQGQATGSSGNNQATGATANQKTGSPNQKGGYLKFKPASVNDPASTGTALTLLLPEGWKLQGGVNWHMDNPTYPAAAYLKATDAANSKSFTVFPMACFCYSVNQNSLRSFPYGSKYMGYTVVNQLPTAGNAIINYLLPYYRKNVQGLKVIETKVLIPEQQQVLANNKVLHKESAMVRVEYTEGGTQYEENIYATRAYTASPGATFNLWILTNCSGFKAPKGQLKANMKLFQTMLFSMQYDKKWYANAVQMSENLNARGVAQAKAAGQRAKMNAEASDERRKQISAAYNNQQQSNDLINDKFADYERDVNTYINPETKEQYKLPAGYTNAWKNDLGEYIVSDVNGFDPGQISTQHWTELQQRQ